MSCHEIAALRLALHKLLGSRPEHERTHEIEELGVRLTEEGPLRALAEADNLAGIRAALDAAALELEQKVADMDAQAPARGYWRALLVTVKRTQGDLDRLAADLDAYYRDLDEVHHVLHETFPESD